MPVTSPKRKRTRVTAVSVITLFMLTSCEDSVTRPSDLAGEWRLEELRPPSGGGLTPPASGRFTVQFEADGRVSARADCNGCGGRYTLDDDRVVVADLACTLIACPNAPFDQQYLAILVGASELELEDGRLILESSRGTLRFRR
jgi:heat shock protein HslJ